MPPSSIIKKYNASEGNFPAKFTSHFQIQGESAKMVSLTFSSFLVELERQFLWEISQEMVNNSDYIILQK